MTKSVLQYIEEIELLIDNSRYREAWPLALELAEVHARDYYLYEICEGCDFTPEECAEMKRAADAEGSSARTVYAYATLSQLAGADLRYFKRAAQMGFLLAEFDVYLLSIDLTDDPTILTLARKGCAECYVAAGHRLWHDEVYLESARFFKMAHDVGFDTTIDMQRLLERYPQECCPYDDWIPQWHLYHELVLPEIQNQVFTWLLVGQRLKLTPYLKLMICRWIITR